MTVVVVVGAIVVVVLPLVFLPIPTGSFNFGDLQRAAPRLAPVFFTTYMLGVYITLINMVSSRCRHRPLQRRHTTARLTACVCVFMRVCAPRCCGVQFIAIMNENYVLVQEKQRMDAHHATVAETRRGHSVRGSGGGGGGGGVSGGSGGSGSGGAVSSSSGGGAKGIRDVDYDVLKRVTQFVRDMAPRAVVPDGVWSAARKGGGAAAAAADESHLLHPATKTPTVLRVGTVVLLVDATWFKLARARLKRKFKGCVYAVMFALVWDDPPEYARRNVDPSLLSTVQRTNSEVKSIASLRQASASVIPMETTPGAGSTPRGRRGVVGAVSVSQPAWRLIRLLSKGDTVTIDAPSPVVLEVIRPHAPDSESSRGLFGSSTGRKGFLAVNAVSPVSDDGTPALPRHRSRRGNSGAGDGGGGLGGGSAGSVTTGRAHVPEAKLRPRHRDRHADRPLFSQDLGPVVGNGSHVRLCRVVFGGEIEGDEKMHMPAIVWAKFVLR
jgi:uncharacterized membrane protein YgcG